LSFNAKGLGQKEGLKTAREKRRKKGRKKIIREKRKRKRKIWAKRMEKVICRIA
jgi:hypothetical protein